MILEISVMIEGRILQESLFGRSPLGVRKFTHSLWEIP